MSPLTNTISDMTLNNEELETWNGKHILKLRDRKVPTEEETPTPDELKDIIEPWLTALFQSEHLSLLTGAGISSAIHYIATGKIGADMSEMCFTNYDDKIDIYSKKSAEKTGRGDANIEDQIRTVNELLKGLKILATGEENDKDLSSKIVLLEKELDDGIKDFANTVLESEKNIVTANKEKAAEYLMNFLLSFASRIATRERLNLFTTNYDRVLEFGAELAGLHLIDRFVGNISPIFRSSRLNIDLHYNPPGIRGEPRYLEGVVNFTKLHGSLDWIEQDGLIRRIALPYGIDDITPYNYSKSSLMIYPNSSKDRETAEYPYVELFRDFASAIIQPNSTVVCYGYSFGDDHINRILRDLLTIPSTHLVIISYDDIGDRIQRFYNSVKRPHQITLMIGSHFGSIETLVDNYLPKPAIDKATYKMVDLLKARTVPIIDYSKKSNGDE